MKQETLVLLPNFIGDAIYEGFEAGPAQLNGKKGLIQDTFCLMKNMVSFMFIHQHLHV